MSYQPISATRFGSGLHGAGWIPQTMRANLLSLLRGRGVGASWGQDVADSGNQPLAEVSSHPDFPLAWPVILPPSPGSRVLRMQLDAEVIVAGVEVALWCAGQQTPWGAPDDLYELASVASDRVQVACVVWRSLRDDANAVSVNVSSPGPASVQRVGGPELAHHVVEYISGDDSCSVWWYRSSSAVWPETALPAISSTAATATPLGTMRVRGGCIWWADGSSDSLPVPAEAADGAVVRARTVRQLGASADLLYGRPVVITCGPTRDLPIPGPSGVATTPLFLIDNSRQWVTRVGQALVAPPLLSEFMVASAIAAPTTSRATRVVVASAMQGAARIRVYAGTTLVAGPVTVEATDAGRRRSTPADSGTTYGILARPAAIHGGLHAAGQEDARRLTLTSIAIARGLINPDERITVTAEGGRGIVATCTIMQEREDITRLAWDDPAPRPLGPILDDTLDRTVRNADALRAGLLRGALSRWVDRPVDAGDEWRAVLPASEPDTAAGLDLRLEIRAQDAEVEVEVDDGVSSVADVHTFTALSTHVYTLALTAGTVYTVAVRILSTGAAPLVTYIRAEEV